MFESALAQLMQLNHDCLRSVVNGGLDPVDGYPWVAARWWDGVALTDRVRHHDLTEEELLRIQAYSKSLINALGPIAGTVAFTPASICDLRRGRTNYRHLFYRPTIRGLPPLRTEFIRLISSIFAGKYKALTTYLRRQARTSLHVLYSLRSKRFHHSLNNRLLFLRLPSLLHSKSFSFSSSARLATLAGNLVIANPLPKKAQTPSKALQKKIRLASRNLLLIPLLQSNLPKKKPQKLR